MSDWDAALRAFGAMPDGPVLQRENAVRRVRLADGRAAALRLHRPGYQSDAAIRSELWWCAALADDDLPVPAPVAAEDGTTLVTLPSGRRASAVCWLPGTPVGASGAPFDLPRDDLVAAYHALGALLARLHFVAARLTLPDGFIRPVWDRDGLVGAAPRWGRFWDHPAATPQQREVLLAARDWLAAQLPDGPAPGLIHADVLRENVLRDGRKVALIDFDDSGFGFPLYDLGTALCQSLAEPAFDDIRDALMAGYGTSDTDGVMAMTLARCCASVGWTMPRLAPADPIHKSHLDRAVMLARRLMG
jgi:Ser/Thr protein kinase RdoA (MazF antagonist)